MEKKEKNEIAFEHEKIERVIQMQMVLYAYTHSDIKNAPKFAKLQNLHLQPVFGNIVFKNSKSFIHF